MNLPLGLAAVLMTLISPPGENVLHVRDADTQNKVYHALELQFGKRYPWYDQCTARLCVRVLVLSNPFKILIRQNCGP